MYNTLVCKYGTGHVSATIIPYTDLQYYKQACSVSFTIFTNKLAQCHLQYSQISLLSVIYNITNKLAQCHLQYYKHACSVSFTIFTNKLAQCHLQ